MKALVLLVAFALLSVCIALQTPDLPRPAANPTTIRAGSLIIPMDGQQLKYSSKGEMSLKPYGVIIRTLYAAKAPILWVIKAGKSADSDDFSAVTTTSTVGSLSFGSQSTRYYSAGPFIIPGEYADEVLSFLKNQLPSDAANGAVCDKDFYSQVAIHRTVSNITVDVRHKLLFKPHPAVSNLSTYYGETHWKLLASRARTTCGRNSRDTGDHAGLDLNTHYEIIQTEDDMLAITGETCFTTVTEPHWAWRAGYAPKYYNAMRNFVVSGGNILCECAGLWSYENYQNGEDGGSGGFLTQHGLVTTQAYDDVADTKRNFADLPISQWNGKFSGSLYGHTPDWYLQWTSAKTEDWQNNAFVVVENIKPRSDGRSVYIASAGKLSNLTIGSMVFYLGSHSYVPQQSNTLAGRRFYFNALLTPPHRPARCGFNVCPRDEIVDCSTLNPPVTTPCTYCKCVDGTAKAFTIPGCCSQSSQCLAGNACQTPKCDVATGTCSYSNIAGCCLSNSTCAGTCRYCDTKKRECAYYDCEDKCQTDAVCGGACKKCNTATQACYTLPFDQCCEENSECPDGTNPCQTAGCNTATHKCFVNNVPNCCYLNSQCTSSDVCKSPSCDLKTNKCILTDIQGCCKTKSDCGTDPCRVCIDNQCVHNYTCCSTDESCEVCHRCDLTTGECVVRDDCCQQDTDCGPCKKCTGGQCFTIPSCCGADSDCEMCQFCDTNTTQLCQPVPGCCVLDRECGACQQCDNETHTCFNAANEECCLSDSDCDEDNCEECKENQCKGDCGSSDNKGVAIGAGIGGGIGGLLLLGGAAAAVAFGIKKHRAHMADLTRKKGDFAEGAMSNPEYEKPFSTVNSPLYNL